jgi:hydrogenase maturation protein HypF
MQVPFFQIQHHKAHLYAVLGENSLLDTEDSIMGVIWDGTGFGEDGQIWGGETFIYRNGSTERVAHLPYFPFILGDKMPKEPRISALAVGSLLDGKTDYLREKFTATEWEIYLPMLAKPTLRTSSMGRVFDAVASIILEINKISYEGEAAMMLEAAASACIKDNPNEKIISYSLKTDLEPLMSILEAVFEDKKNGKSSGLIAARFHRSLVNLIRHEAQRFKLKKIAFSGGVFQNGLLVDMILTDLQKEFELFFHKQLSPNDECISFGQMAYYSMHEKNLT